MKKRYETKRATFVVSTKRSGHHAFIDWYARALERPVAFFNNALPAQPPAVREAPYYYGNHPHLPGWTPAANLLASPHEVIINFEGRDADRIEGPCKSATERQLGRAVTTVYFLRDPLNCFASQVKRAQDRNNRFYLSLTSQIIGFESIIARISKFGRGKDLVAFSGWRYDAEARAEIAEQLGVSNPPPAQGVTAFGGGSSFFRDMTRDMTRDMARDLAVAPEPDKDALLSRWRQMVEDPAFLAVFLHPETRSNFEQYFALAGRRELLSACGLEEIYRAADRSSAAQTLFDEKLAPFRRALPLIRKLQGAGSSVEREVLRARLQLATGLPLHRA